MSVHVTFFNADLVEQLAACGITARRRLSQGTPPQGFVVNARATARARGGRAVTNVIDVRGNVTITGPQLRLPAGEAFAPSISAAAATEPRTALELVEDCARLRRDNQRLTDEVARLRAEVNRLTAGPEDRSREVIELDDAERRFSLIELDL